MVSFRDEINQMKRRGGPAAIDDVLARMRSGMKLVNAPMELLEPASDCPGCNGTGYVRYDVPVGHEKFGRMFDCENPDCPYVARRKAEVMQRKMHSRHGNWTPKMASFTFDSFRAFIREAHGQDWDYKRDAYGTAHAFAHFDGQPFTLSQAVNYASNGKWASSPNDAGFVSNSVVLYGEPGYGKTALGAAAANALLARGQRVLFVRMKHMTDVVQETYKDAALYSKADEISVYSTVDYLVLDEFAANNPTKDRIDILETILRERMDLNDRPTLFTTNFMRPSDVQVALAGSDAADGAMRIVAMLKKCHWVKVAGAQLRPQQTDIDLMARDVNERF